MKSLLMTFMMLVMFTPGLACAQTICASMDEMAEATADMPCHGEVVAEEPNSNVMLIIDCADVDLALTEPPSVSKAKASTDPVIYSFLSTVTAQGWQITDARFVRGPPDVHRGSNTYPSVFLNTQRIRI